MTNHLISAVTATTSAVLPTTNIENLTVHFLASGISSGNGVLTILGSNDGTNFLALNIFVDNVTNTNAQTLTRVASKTLSSNTSALVSVENLFKFQFLKFTVTVTTDGTYDVWLGYDIKTRH